MARIASFHLVRERPGRAVVAMARLGLDRPRLSRVPGLVFWRLLGTGDGSNTGPGADLRRTALFAVWEDTSAIDAFETDGPFVDRWASADESWHCRLRGLGGHGTWRGVGVLDDLEPGAPDGRIAVITRADVRRSAWREFRQAGREVDTELHTASGLIDVVGIGEAPVGRLATFSLWESAAAVQAYAYGMPRHRRVIEQTRDGDWYGEEMFARFEPFASRGTWDGRDPLAEVAQPPS